MGGITPYDTLRRARREAATRPPLTDSDNMSTRADMLSRRQVGEAGEGGRDRFSPDFYGEDNVSRSVPDAALSPLLVVAPVAAQPALGSLQRLEHEYALRDALEPTWAARLLALVRHQGWPMLVRAAPGGELLARLLGQPWEIAPFLHVAIGLAVALVQLHSHGLLHKDVKPTHILANTATGEA
jgi:hypothetical protein